MLVQSNQIRLPCVSPLLSSAASLEPMSKNQKILNNMKLTSDDTAEPDKLFEHEVVRYLKHLSNNEETEQPLCFGRTSMPYYPLLSRFAKEYLGIPSSSVPMEYMFSTLGLIMNSKRSSLNHITMNMISFIHDNMKLLKNSAQWTRLWIYY